MTGAEDDEFLAQVWVLLKAQGCDCNVELKLVGDAQSWSLGIKHADGCHWKGPENVVTMMKRDDGTWECSAGCPLVFQRDEFQDDVAYHLAWHVQGEP